VGCKTNQDLTRVTTLNHLVKQIRNHFPAVRVLQNLLQLLLAELAAQRLSQALISNSRCH
tara:strand:+ start:672 stop:851 length:180 start_codon:yes stop_codon:yes gene_type:complete